MTSDQQPILPDAIQSDLKVAVSARDHLVGLPNAAVTLVEYGDFACRFCSEAHPVVEALRERFGTALRFVFRHNPRGELHPHARIAAHASEAAAVQGKFWGMQDLLFAHPDALEEADLLHYALELGLDEKQFANDLNSPAIAKRVRDDEVGGAHSNIISSPTFFINGARFHDKPDLETLAAAISAAA